MSQMQSDLGREKHEEVERSQRRGAMQEHVKKAIREQVMVNSKEFEEWIVFKPDFHGSSEEGSRSSQSTGAPVVGFQ